MGRVCREVLHVRFIVRIKPSGLVCLRSIGSDRCLCVKVCCSTAVYRNVRASFLAMLSSDLINGSSAGLIPLANPSILHRTGRKRTDHEDERAKGVSPSENMHDRFTIARFTRFKTLHPGEAFPEIFCAWLQYHMHQVSPAVSGLVRKAYQQNDRGSFPCFGGCSIMSCCNSAISGSPNLTESH
jgi:hypothetical protein